jgi:hypothetical protein
MARSHRNSLAHAVKRTSQGLTNAVGMRPSTGNWNPTTTRNLTTRTSLRTRNSFQKYGFVSVAVLACETTTRCDLIRTRPGTSFGYQEIHAASLSSALRPRQAFKFQQSQSMANQYQPPPVTIILAPSYEFRSCVRNRTWLLISSHLWLSSDAQGRNHSGSSTIRRSYIERQATGDRLPMKTWGSYLVDTLIYQAGIFAFGQEPSSDIHHVQRG